MKRAFLGIALTAAVLLASSGARAADRAQGHWIFLASGQALLGSGTCQFSSMSVPTSLSSGNIYLTPDPAVPGTGTVSINFLLNIGATNCTSANFHGTGGSYTVVDRADGSFEATGTFSVSPSASLTGACSAINLKGVDFDMIGGSAGASLAITGFSSTGSGVYSEAPGSCTEPIMDITAKGTAKPM